MTFGYEETRLWRHSLATSDDDPYSSQRQKLTSAYHNFRERAALVAAEIPQDLREFTVHDVTHLDALWEMADQVSGEDIHLTPTEAFVLGGAFLIHDLGMGLAAWPGGLEQLQAENTWPDVLAGCISGILGRPVTDEDLATPPEEALRWAKEIALRERHAFRAAKLALTTWTSQASGATYSLIEHTDLRERYGELIGEIAASHWWDIKQVAERFSAREPIGAPVDCPDDWTVDELKLACLMRVSDAAHLDERRAPGFLRALRNPTGYSDRHWAFQGPLQRPRRADDVLVYSSSRAFGVADAQAWWVCYESLQMVDGELRSVDSLLVDRGRTRLAARGVRGIEDPQRLAENIRTTGWTPIDARPRIDNVPALVRKLGGESLYGNEPLIALRELIQNARDATRASEVVLQQAARPVQVDLREDDEGHWHLRVNDFGVGMSTSVLSRTLLDFGQSYWGSDLMRRELPGLAASPFAAVGRFGVGFYSVFMLGDRVTVVSRRYDDASSSTRVLEFDGGVTTRPILRPARREEVRHFGGTSVTIRLRVPPAAEGGLLRYGAGETVLALDEACAFIAPALDCDLESKFSDDAYQRCVSANDWMTIPGEHLLRRVSEQKDYSTTFRNADQTLSEVADRLRPIEVGGRVVGRASLAPAPPAALDAGGPVVATSSCVTLGGLRAGSDAGGITGVVLGRPTTADRLRYELEYDPAAWANWATEQAALWADYVNENVSRGGYVEADHLPNLVCRLGGHPRGMQIARSALGPLDIEEVKQWAMSLDEVVLCDDFELDVQVGAHGDVVIWHRDDHCRLTIHNSILFGFGGGRYGSWDHYGDPAPDKTHAYASPELESSKFYYYRNQLEVDGLLVRTIAEAWSQDLDKFLDNLEIFRRPVKVPIGFTEEGQEVMSSRPSWRAHRGGKPVT